MVSRIFRPPALGRVRLAEVDDSPIILGLLTESMSKNFRVEETEDIVYLIENCVLSICQLDINDTIVGFLAIKDYPLIPSVHPEAWEEYIWIKYKSIELNSRNTLFLHLLCWNPAYAREVVDKMLRSIFLHDPYLHYIAMVKPLLQYPLLIPGQSRAEASFRRVAVTERGMSGDQLPALSIADRSEICPRLRIRRAVEEDNDDIVPIIERHSARLRELYGEFYISELIARHPESERVLLVCEHNELAVGVMCLNTQINYEALEESFELSPYGGLRHLEAKPAYKDKDLDSAVNLVDNIYSQYNIHNFYDHGSLCNLETMRTSARDVKSKVAWAGDDIDFRESCTGNSVGFANANQHATPLGPYTNLDILNLLEDEEEEMEFDIINIDKDLLRIPEMLSYDSLTHGPAEYITKMLEVKHRESITDDKSNTKEKKKSSAVNTPTPEPIRYSGPPNAFLLELFAMHPDYDERQGFDMLEVAFELFPNRDYCVMCLPSNHAAFPLLEHFTLVTPYCRRLRFINESLYVAHVNSLRGNVKVRPGEAYDLANMNYVLEHAPRKQALLDLFQSTFFSHTLDSYVFISQNLPIGMVVLGPLEDGTAIRTQYDLLPEPRRANTDGAVLAGVMSPTLEPHIRWYMRELLRQSRYTTLFWICRLMAKGDASPCRNLMSMASSMTPVRPRRFMPNLSGNKDLDQIFRDISTPFALWTLERPLTCLPKVDVNSSIVVVGASRTGLAFLETLLMGPTAKYLIFTNVSLVSEHGLPTVTECLRAADTCMPRDSRFTDRYLKSVPFYFYLDVMSATMIKIDRQKKCIHLKGGGVKYYDELILTCGQQFQHPEYLKESLELDKETEKGKPCERILMDNPKYHPAHVLLPPDMPENVMLINSLCEANICLRKLLRMISDAKETPGRLSGENQVVVYGDCIEAYSNIAALLELGLAPEMIVFVEPFPPEDVTAIRVNCFNNEIVDERVQASLDKLGIHVFRRCHLTSWRQRDNHVETLRLMSPLYAFQLPCFALFYYGRKAIDIHAFKAINECGLVYDGGLIVGPAFETNDPYIYGAGSCAKYSRRLYATHRSHRHYCSENVGEALAKLFLRKLDPFVMGDPDIDACPSEVLPKYSSSILTAPHPSIPNLSRFALGKLRRWQPVTKFESPIVLSATLPGPLYYMKFRKPGPEIPIEVELSLPHQGHILVTDKNKNYFRLHLNALHCVEAVTCLSKKIFSSEVLSQLYGKHEGFFNKLLTRYQMNQITDMYEFFTQPWLAALYQETFDDLLCDINEQDVGTVYDLVKSRFTLVDQGTRSSMLSRQSSESCYDIPSCGFGPKEAKNLGTFRSVIDRFVARTSTVQLVQVSEDILTECGQSAAIRSEAAGFWRTVGGQRIVNAHLARYLDRNNVTNPHYALPKPEFK